MRHHCTCLGVEHVFCCSTAQDAVTQRLNHFTAFDDGAHQVTVVGSAVQLGHDQVLGHVHQTAGQVTRVRCFQGRICQAFTCTVGRDEVLQHVQAFAEVRSDRRFNDRAIGLGHQTAHTCNLANLRCRAARTGVGHHVDGVERLLLHLLAMAIGHHFFGQFGHHDFGDFVT